MSIAEEYRIKKELGSQKKRKFGRAFLVISIFNPQQKAILKTIGKTEHNTHLQDRLRNEKNYSFDFSQLPSVLGFEETENEIFLLLHFKEGVTLDEYWKTVRKNDRIKTLKTLLLSLNSTFELLKSKKIVHCDIKPSNILVNDHNGKIETHLIDFGLALNTEDHTEREILFPLGYAAPELILNRLECIDHTTDIFALGITIWRLFTGSLPLVHPNPSIYTNLQIVHPLPEHNAIPHELWKILAKMCHKHAFKTAPNLMSAREVSEVLKLNNTKRYEDLHSIMKDLSQLQDRNWLNTILFGILKRN